MDWLPVLILGCVVVGFILLKQVGQIGSAAAIEHLKRGAIVIDVRSLGEFQDRHLPRAINIPLGELKAEIPRKLPDKNQVLLLHCRSGGRSAMAQRTLKSMGYKQVFNLGSYARAEQIVTSSR